MSRSALKALQAAAGAASGGSVTYVDDVFSTYLYDGNGTAQTINNGIALGNGPANGTVLHLTGDSLVDSSPSSKTVTNNNSVSVSTSVKKYGTGSLQFDGVDQYLSIASSADFNFGTNDFTIEGWFYAQSDSDDRGAIFELYASDNDMLRVMINTGGVLEFRMQAGGANQMTITTTSWSNNTWHHFAVVNYNGTINCYLDGTSFGSSSSFTMPNLASAQVLVGVDLYATDRWYTGYIDDLRVTKNRAVYTANFTPPSSAHSLDTQVTGDGGMVWLKGRFEIGNTSNSVTGTIADTVRGATKFSYDELTAAEGTNSGHITRFNSDGFDVGSYSLANSNNMRMCAWSFRKQPGFFDVQTYTGTGSTQTVSHDLGCKPGLVIVKRLDSSSAWGVYGRNGASDSEIGIGYLNQNSAFTTSGVTFSCTSSAVTIFSSSFSFDATASGGTFVVYFFAMGGTDSDAAVFGEDSDESIIACGAYSGNGSTTGPVINLGWEPQWIMVKASNDTSNWTIMDTMRGITTGGNEAILSANNSTAENSSSYNYVKVTPTGFQPENSNTAINASGYEYIYMAIRRPHKPASELTATDMFSPIVGTNSSDWKFDAGFPVDLHFYSATSNNRFVFDRLRGDEYLTFNSYSAGSAYTCDFDYMNYCDVSGSNNNGWTMYNFKRTPGFFDMLVYKGDGSSSQTLSHNLDVAPELIITKNRDDGGSLDRWWTYSSVISGSNQGFALNENTAVTDVSNLFPSAPTADNMYVGSISNYSNESYIAYLFATTPGISKVGTYTGTGANGLDIDCGFTNGARFVLIKRTDNTGDWYLFDSARGIVAGNDPYFLLNSTSYSNSTDYIEPLSSGFQLNNQGNATVNWSGANYVFLAIA